MVNYKKTGKYVQTPESTPSNMYFGVPEQVDYSGKSTRVDDNFAYLKNHINDGQAYYAGTGLNLSNYTFTVDTNFIDGRITAAIANKQNVLTAGDNIQIDGDTISVVGIAQYSNATQTTRGLMSAADKTKLDGIAASANNYELPVASSTVLGGIKVGANLTIEDGVLNATNSTYVPAVPSSGGIGGTTGLFAAADKEKLDSIAQGATRVIVDNNVPNGSIKVNNNNVVVYVHPAYSAIENPVDSGKVINGVFTDELGHVTGLSVVNASNVSVNNVGEGVVTSLSYDSNSRVISANKSYAGSAVIGTLDTTTESTSIYATDTISTIVKKLQNRISGSRTNLEDEIDKLLEFKGNASSEPQNYAEGDVYKVTAGFTLNNGSSVVPGDLIIRHSGTWYVIPSGEKSDTWRPIVIDDGNSSTEILPNVANSGALRLKGTGITDLVWDANTNTLSIQTLGVGPGGAGGTTYIGGTGISENHASSTDPETGVVTYRTTFNLVQASDTDLGGIRLGRGLSKDNDGTVNVVPAGYEGINGIRIENGVIQPNYGVNVDQIARGNHTHNIGSLLGIDPADIQEGDVVTFYHSEWRCLPPACKTYTQGNNVEIVDLGDNLYEINATDTNTNRALLINGNTELISSVYDSINLIAGDGISISTGRGSIPDTLNVTITSSTCRESGGSTPTYDAGSGISINDNLISVAIQQNSGINVNSYGLGLNISNDSTNTLSLRDGYLYARDTNTTYSAQINGGLTLNGTAFSASVDNDTIKINEDGELCVNRVNGSTTVQMYDTIVSFDGSTTAKTVQNNTIYRLRSTAITSISISSFADDFAYCTICFKTKNADPTTTWYSSFHCTGFDCSGGTFDPTPNAEYQIAIDNFNGNLQGYVLRID